MRSERQPVARLRQRSRRLWALWLASALGWGLATAPRVGGGEIVERILAVVEGHPLMLSEVRLGQRVKGVSQEAAVESLIDEWLMYREAERLPQTAADTEVAYRALLERLPASFEVHGDEPLLRRMATRQARILRYIQFRFEPLVRVGDDQVRAAYAEDHASVAEPPAFESVEADLRRRLARRDLDEKIEAWVSELRSSAEIRYNPSP